MKPSDGPSNTSIDDAELRTLWILQAALTAAPVMFLIVVAVLPTPGHDGGVGDGPFQTIELFSAVHAFLALGCLGAAMVVPGIVSRQGQGLGAIRSALIIRMALLEGVALFGTVIIFLAKNWGVLAEQPLVWGNAATTGLLIAISLGTFPTRDRVEQHLRDGAADL